MPITAVAESSWMLTIHPAARSERERRIDPARRLWTSHSRSEKQRSFARRRGTMGEVFKLAHTSVIVLTAEYRVPKAVSSIGLLELGTERGAGTG
ncbi:MAG: hypothetical protein V2B18_10920 [Pseudomonadota bacterium]